VYKQAHKHTHFTAFPKKQSVQGFQKRFEADMAGAGQASFTREPAAELFAKDASL
jgi:hypothetical protein